MQSNATGPPFSTDTTPAIPEPRRRLTATSLPSIDRAGFASAEPIVTADSTQHPHRPSMPLRKTSDQGTPFSETPGNVSSRFGKQLNKVLRNRSEHDGKLAI
ncbi:hypothetical protein [Burkholderia gladioli]|uniref:hypothetical protein n=1 Tax=Burkholderia gladioli TaxID=28095 RepID=UPI0016401455|nr:hypothetical protein [Burkholderia gladioli]